MNKDKSKVCFAVRCIFWRDTGERDTGLKVGRCTCASHCPHGKPELVGCLFIGSEIPYEKLQWLSSL